MGVSQTEILEMFLKLGYLSPESLKNLKMAGERRGVPLLEATLLEGILHPDARSFLLAESLGLAFEDIDPAAVPLAMSEFVPESTAREYRIAPLSREEDRLTLGVADPFLHPVFSVIGQGTGLSVRLVVCPPRTINRILDRLYPNLQAPASEELEGGLVDRGQAGEWLARGRARTLVEKTLSFAVGGGISSVRIFPAGNRVRVSGRAGGENALLFSMPIRYRGALLGGLAELAALPGIPAEASESSFQLEGSDGVLSFQLLFLHGLSGPEAIVRHLPEFRPAATLGSVGLTPEQVEITCRLLGKKDGLYLLSTPGPEGAATTMFAMLREMVRPGARVVTVEERFRFRTERYIQLERRDLETRYGGRWAQLAGAVEPDALMVEFLRDSSDLIELVHLVREGVPVLCGVRGSGVGDVVRTLLSLRIDPFLLFRTVRLILHQRLVDLLCTECRRPVPAKPSLLPGGGKRGEMLEEIIRKTSFYMPAGCDRCAGKGYSGKIALAEALPFSHGVQSLLLAGLPVDRTVEQLTEEHLYPAFPSVRELLGRGMVAYDDILPFFR